MKAFFSGHWEKLTASVAFLLLAASVIFNFVVIREPAVVGEVSIHADKLQALMNSTTAKPLPDFSVSGKEVEARLSAQVPSYSLPQGLLSGSSKGGLGTLFFTVGDAGQDRDLVEIKCNEVVSDNRRVAEAVLTPDHLHVQITPKGPGKTKVQIKLNGLIIGFYAVQVSDRNRVELWTPNLLAAKPNDANPGEVELTWADHPATAPGGTLGYVIERRILPDGKFQPLLGAGKMLPASITSYTDATAEPGRSYEYRLHAVADPKITDVMPEAAP